MRKLKIFFPRAGKGEVFLSIIETALRTSRKAGRMNIPQPDVHPPKISLKSKLDEPSIFRKSLESQCNMNPEHV